MNILYVTSFNKELYNATGKKLLSSFYDGTDWKIKGDLLIGKEGNFDTLYGTNEHIIHDLEKDYFLQNWLHYNQDIIPDYLGGQAKPCKCRNPFAREDRNHTKGCHFSWWNRNCSRWFRKIATLNYVMNYQNTYGNIGKYDYFVWLDADCIFLKEPHDILENIASWDVDLFYMRGTKRRAVETGIFGIKNSDMGGFFVSQIVNLYLSKKYRTYDRWDDGFIFKIAIGESPLVRSIDIAAKCNKPDVADFTCLTPYIKHNKGTHGRKLNIMK